MSSKENELKIHNISINEAVYKMKKFLQHILM